MNTALYELESIDSTDTEKLVKTAQLLLDQHRPQEAAKIFNRLAELNPADLNSRFIYAQLLDDGTHKSWAQMRDRFLSILDDYPTVIDENNHSGLQLMRYAAMKCIHVGPTDKAIELLRKLAPLSKQASDYFHLSEVLSQGAFLEESIASLQKAILLDPTSYDNEINRDTLKIAHQTASGAQKNKSLARNKIGRYPTTDDFTGDFQSLMKNHIAVNLKNDEKFLDVKTKFFTMGSCFARNISKSLNSNGYNSTHMEISEHINTTFANKAFVDWLADPDTKNPVNSRIRELLPDVWSAESISNTISNSDVLILTLGVAPAFFDRTTGDFVLPRPTSLNSRVLAEKYEFRTTSVTENVSNVLHLLNYIKKLAPKIKIIITVSPVPIMASFEYESCVQADCLSKSTMRLVAHEVVNNSGLQNIIYWPSFEVFRWAGSNSSKYFGADDGAAWHVSEEMVNGTIEAFIDIFKT